MMTKWDTIQEDVFGFSKAIELDHLNDEQLDEIATMLGIK